MARMSKFGRTHDDNLPALGGPELPTQGDGVVIRPDGKGGWKVMAQFKPTSWSSLRGG